MSRLKDKYTNEIVPKFLEKPEYGNIFAVPRVEKVVINMGVGVATKNRAEIDRAQEDLTNIAGQKAVVTHSRKAVAAFGLPRNFPIGVKVTLRQDRMYEFLDKLFNIIFPRTRDFRGLKPTAFDGAGNYSVGLEDQVVFPEIDPNTLDRRRSMQVIIVTSAETDEAGRELLLEMGLPLEKEEAAS